MRVLLSFLLASFLMVSSYGAEWTIETVAGRGLPGFSGDYGPAVSAHLDNPFGISRGPDGALWICEHGGQRIRRIRSDGVIFTAAGDGKKRFAGDGLPVLEASFSMPEEACFDSKGDLFVADMGNSVVRKVDFQTGVIRTIVGTGLRGYEGDGGSATVAYLRQPHHIRFGPDHNLYIADTGNHAIRKVDMNTGIISTVAGTGRPGPTPDGAPIAGTPLRGPRGIDFDREGNLWVVTQEGNQVFKVDFKAGRMVLMAGTGAKGFTGNGGPAREATFRGPKGIALDSEGNAWIADTENNAVRMIDSKTGRLELMVGTGERGDGPDGDPLHCRLARVHGIFIDSDGSVYIGDSESHCIRVMRKKNTNL